MPVGSTEIVRFDAPGTTAGKNRSALQSDQVNVCGKCGAMVAPGFESTHATWHNTGAWSQQAMTSRDARGPWDQNAP